MMDTLQLFAFSGDAIVWTLPTATFISLFLIGCLMLAWSVKKDVLKKHHNHTMLFVLFTLITFIASSSLYTNILLLSVLYGLIPIAVLCVSVYVSIKGKVRIDWLLKLSVLFQAAHIIAYFVAVYMIYFQ